MKKVPLNILIPSDLKKSFKKKVDNEYDTMTHKIIELMIKYVKEKK